MKKIIPIKKLLCTSVCAIISIISSYGQMSIPNTFAQPQNCSALNFDGQNNYLELTSNLVPTNNVTIATWIKLESLDGENILYWGPKTGCSPSAQSFRVMAGKLQLATGCGTTVEGSTTLSIGVWYHVAVSIDGSGNSTLYLNGVQDGSGTGRTGNGSTVNNISTAIGVGYSSGNLINFFDGDISELSIWNKELSTAELTTVVSGSLTGLESDLVAYYPMNEGEGSVIKEQSLAGTLQSNGEFNGMNSYISVPDIMPASDFSVTLQITPDSLTSTTIFRLGTKSGCNPSSQAVTLENGKVKALTGCGGSNFILSTTTLVSGNSYSITYTMSSTGTAKIYIDGTLEASGNTRNGNSVGRGNINIGRNFSSGIATQYYKGTIGEVSIWEKELTATEVSNQLMSGVSGTETGLVALYELSDIASGSVVDNSTNGNNAIAFNFGMDVDVKGFSLLDNFNGTTTVIDPKNGISSATDYSLMFTFTPTNVTAGTFYYYGPTTGCNPSGQSLILDNGRVKFITGCGGNENLESTTKLVNGQTYHIALLMNSAGISSLYIDGVFETSGDTRNGNSIGLGNDLIGARYSAGNLIGYLNGSLEEVSIWNVTLSGTGVSNIMNNGISGNEQGLKTWYDLSTYTTGNVLDKTSNVNNGVPTNLSVFDVLSIPTWSIINQINTGVTVSSNQLSTDNINADSYQWLDCNNGNAIINNEINTSFTAVTSGSYAVEITQGSCVDTSSCEMIVITSLGNEISNMEQLMIYPNPATSIINTEEGKLEIIDLTGNLVLSTNSTGQVDVSSLESGVYLVTQNGKRTKLIVE